MVKQLTVISGKGGTGKTTVSSSFAALAENPVIADCDVDAADMHLILHPEITEKYDFFGLQTAHIDYSKCNSCGICAKSCRFGAIDLRFSIDSYKCEGCAVCAYVCPENAITMTDKKAGEYYCSETRFGPLVHARLEIGEEASGKLVSHVRRRAMEVARERSKDLIIIDGPPGTGCALIAAITGADIVLIVTEPTLSGIHDMQRVADVAKHFRIPVAVCINKYDINREITGQISDYCKDRGMDIAGMLPYSKSPVEAMLSGRTVIEMSDDTFSAKIRTMWQKLSSGTDL